MQAEQVTTTTNTVKKTPAKKGGKKVTEQQAEVAPVVTEVVQEATPVVVEQPVQLETTTTTTTQNDTTTQDETVNTTTTTETSYQSVIEGMNKMSEDLLTMSKIFKEENMDRETRTKFETAYNKLLKSNAVFTRTYNEALFRQLNALEKSGSKSGVKKQIVDKDKIAIHKKHTVHDFLLTFMKLPSGTPISRAQALTAITSFVKEQKEKNPDIIVADDKKSFKIIGDLKELFDGIEKHLKAVGKFNKPMPTQIKYTDIMTYMAHCFVKDTPTVV